MAKWASLAIMAAFLLLLPPLRVEAQQGGYVDTIYLNVRTQQEIGLRDTIEGITDLFYPSVPGAMVEGLDARSKDRLDIYRVPSGSWSLQFNPIPNEAPYIVKVGGREYFNPFAIREVRFAMNDLINRQLIVDEIQNGLGGPMITMATPPIASSAFYNQIPPKLGITAQGNEQKALQDIDRAMTEASNLPELRGRLTKRGNSWYFDNQPVSVKFVIRVDDPERTRLGNYVSQQIEKAGMRVEKLLWDRSRASNTVLNGNPADYEWNIYTEGWGAGATRAYWELIIAQMYAPFYAWMPGGMDPSNWNYRNDELDALAIKALYGNVLSEEEYWETCEKAVTLGLQEAVRVYVSYQEDYYVANRDRFNHKMLYGLGDGINRLSLMTANTKDGVLRATEFSAQGALFMGAWDPVGVDGFVDVYSNFIWNTLYASTFLGVGNPVTGLPDNETVVVDWNSINTKVVERNGEVVGDLSVPSNAVLYNTTSKRWEPVGSGVKTMSTLTETVKLWRWHSGHMMSMADVVGYIGFDNEWAKQDGPDDRYYDASYSSASIEGINTKKGYVFDPQRSQVRVYDDYNFPADKSWLAGNLAVGAGTSNFCYPIPWQLREALGRMVAEGSASRTVYSFTGGKATDIDVLNPTCVSDIRAELVKMRDQRYIPPYIGGYTTESETLEGYNAIIKFIDDHGHAAISNGAFYLEQYDARGPSITLKRWNDFPYPPEYWLERFSTEIPRVDRIDTPIAQRGRDASVAVRVSDVQYPEGSSKPSTTSKVTVTLALPEGSRTYDARHQGAGVYIATIPAKDLEGIDPGSYVVMATATNRGGHIASGSTNILLRG